MNFLQYLLLPVSSIFTVTSASNVPIFFTNSSLAAALHNTLPTTNISSVPHPTLPPADTEWLDVPAEDLATFFKIPDFSFRAGVTIQYICETSAASPRVADAIGAIVGLGHKPGACIQKNPYPVPGCTAMNRWGSAAVGQCGMRGWAVNCMEAAGYLSYLPFRCARWYGGVQRSGGVVRIMYTGGAPGLLVNLYHT